MSRDEIIMRVYRDGSSQERMDAYLAYPGLRVRFDEIEREGERRSPPGKTTRWNRWLLRFCRPFASGRRFDPS